MKTVREALETCYSLSSNDRIVFCSALSDHIETDQNSMEVLMMETRYSEKITCPYCESEPKKCIINK